MLWLHIFRIGILLAIYQGCVIISIIPICTVYILQALYGSKITRLLQQIKTFFVLGSFRCMDNEGNRLLIRIKNKCFSFIFVSHLFANDKHLDEYLTIFVTQLSICITFHRNYTFTIELCNISSSASINACIQVKGSHRHASLNQR